MEPIPANGWRPHGGAQSSSELSDGGEKKMQVEIVFTGLCSFLNIHDINPLMPEPSVILVTTDIPALHDHGDGNPEDHKHTPFIAYKTATTMVDDEKGFDVVDQTLKQFKFLGFEGDLQGVRLSIDTAPPGKPVVHPSYDGDENNPGVVRRDDYWPEAANQFNRDYVPEPGGKPKKSAVNAFMRFGAGVIWASRYSKVEWIFKSPKQEKELRGKFPEEVVFAFQNAGDHVIIKLTDLQTGELKRILRFSPVDANVTKLTLNIGNNVTDDMDNAVLRLVPKGVREGHHFDFLNMTAPAANLPSVKLGEQPADVNKDGGGGGLGGACGPNNGNS
jgi:hypothetical protein